MWSVLPFHEAISQDTATSWVIPDPLVSGQPLPLLGVCLTHAAAQAAEVATVNSLPSLSSFPSLLTHMKGDKADVRAWAPLGKELPAEKELPKVLQSRMGWRPLLLRQEMTGNI